MGLINAARDMRTIKRLLTRPAAEALRAGEEAPAPEHLFLAATTLTDVTAAHALERVGIDPQGRRTAIDQVHVSVRAAVGDRRRAQH